MSIGKKKSIPEIRAPSALYTVFCAFPRLYTLEQSLNYNLTLDTVKTTMPQIWKEEQKSRMRW